MAKLVESDVTKEVSRVVEYLMGLYSDYGFETVDNSLMSLLDKRLRQEFPDSRTYILKDLLDSIRNYY